MEDTKNLRCEQFTSDSYGRKCREVATHYVLGRSRTLDGSVEWEAELYCGRHAAGFRRRSYTNNDEMRILTDDIRAVKVAELTKRNEREAEIRAVKAAEAESRRQVALVEAWSEVAVEWVMTLEIEERYRWADQVEQRVSIAIHRADRPSDGWDVLHVEISEEADAPATVVVRGGSPMHLTTKGALVLSSAIALVAEWVGELNA